MQPRFRRYSEFKRFIWEDYEPFACEMTTAPGYRPGSSWAQRHAPRFYRTLRALQGQLRSGSALLDVGAYPGSFVRLARATFGEGLQVAGCGMPVESSFAERLKEHGIAFTACNLDPDVVSPESLPVGLPYPSESFDVITAMEVVEHLYSLKTLFCEVRRVLKPHGIFYVTTNNVMDRVGLLRLFRTHDTNLDSDIEQTTIWSDYTNQWRGHVRFYSVKQLAQVGDRASLRAVQCSGFEHHEDPDVYVHDDAARSSWLRRWLRGDGQRPPRKVRAWLPFFYRIGPRAWSSDYDSHIELLFQATQGAPMVDSLSRTGV